MTDDPKPTDEKQKRFGSGCFLAICFLLILYVLSPPIVAWISGVSFMNDEWIFEPFYVTVDSPIFDSTYFPLKALTSKSPVISEFYRWYFGLFPLDRIEPRFQ